MIRKAEIKDIRKILEIVNYEIIHSTVLYEYKERSYEFQREWFDKKTEDGMPVIVYEDETGIRGFGTYGIFRPWPAYQFSVEHSLYVDKDARGLGVGGRILSELINLAKNSGYHTMIAGIDSLNYGSFEFHKKFGFIEVGKLKQVGYKFNTWLDLHFLQLLLN